MSFGNWLHNIATRGCLIAAFFLGVAACERHAGAQDQPKDNTQAQQPQTQQNIPDQSRPPAIEQPNPAVTAEEQKPKTKVYQYKCDTPPERDDADVCEQRRMAVAAERQLVVNIVGAVFLLGTLIFTGWAALAAARGANAAADTVHAMRNAERAYFFVLPPSLRNWQEAAYEAETDEVGILDVTLEIAFNISNSGKGIGFITSYGITHEICFEGKQGSKELTIRSDMGLIPLRGDSKYKTPAAYHTFRISVVERDELLGRNRPTKNLYIYGYLRYIDLFKVIRRTGFAYEFIPIGEDDAPNFVMTPGPLWYDEEEKPEKQK